ncbi:hypothetical protein K438DRAFT_1977003 [Mycena galopus ATCC 62051]|nr:hypothetical protein K438DRAFT_1977003 [Mycena galopus ATCC 62051]
MVFGALLRRSPPHPHFPDPASSASSALLLCQERSRNNAVPFSPASVRSFSASAGAFTSGAFTPHGHGNNASIGSGYPFPNLSLGSTRVSSLVDVPRAFSTYWWQRGSLSRPNTGTNASNLHPGTAVATNGSNTTAANGGAGNGIEGNAGAAASAITTRA